MKNKWLTVLLAAVTIVAIFGSCTSDTPDNTTNTTDSGQYSISIYLDDSLVDSVILDDLLALEQVDFSTEGKDEEGPTLLSVLQSVGIEDFDEVTAAGLSRGRIAEAEITLTRSQVNEQVVLDITNSGTSKLASPDIPSNDWIIDVDELRVK